MNRWTSAKLLASPSETRTAPPVGIPSRARYSSKLVPGAGATPLIRSFDSPNAASPAPGLQKHPVRTEMSCVPDLRQLLEQPGPERLHAPGDRVDADSLEVAQADLDGRD